VRAIADPATVVLHSSMMSNQECLKIAGDAAQVLDEMGFVSVARLRDGIVTLECWERGSSRMVRQIVDDPRIPTQALADLCAAALRSAGASPLS